MTADGLDATQDTFVDRLLGEDPGQDAIIAGARRVSRGQARDTTLRLAAALRENGLTTGDGVGILVGNSPESIMIAAAVRVAGCRLVFVPTTARPRELAEFVAEADLAALVFEPEFADRLRHLAVPRVLALGDLLGDLLGAVAQQSHATTDNVYPRLLDDFLESLPGVREAATVGAADEDRIEHVTVFLVPEPGDRVVDTEELRQSILAEFGAAYLPDTITIVDVMPRTTLGAPDRHALRALARATCYAVMS